MSPAVIQDSTKCLGVTTKDMNIFLQTQSHPASPSHWFVAGFEALALAGPSPQCRWQGCPSMPFSPPTLAGWCGSQELVDKPVTESAEMGQALLWKSASWLHRGELVGFQGWEGSFFSLPQHLQSSHFQEMTPLLEIPEPSPLPFPSHHYPITKSRPHTLQPQVPVSPCLSFSLWAQLPS